MYKNNQINLIVNNETKKDKHDKEESIGSGHPVDPYLLVMPGSNTDRPIHKLPKDQAVEAPRGSIRPQCGHPQTHAYKRRQGQQSL